MSNIVVAAKCAPEEPILDAVVESGLTAVELYTDDAWLSRVDSVVKLCKKYPLRYAVHAPTQGYNPDLVVKLIEEIGAEVAVFHNLYFEDEWLYLKDKFSRLHCIFCIENISCGTEPHKYMRRFGFRQCLDFEHLVNEVHGIFEEPLPILIKGSSHVHMTGYVFGSTSWHTHLHHAPEQSTYFLNFLKKVNYSGLVVSEAQVWYQTLEEFKALHGFYQQWLNSDKR